MKTSINRNTRFSRAMALLLALCMLTVCLPLSATAAEEETVLKAGAAIADITPTQDMYPLSWGSGGRGYAFIGAAERIHVRVIALQNDDGPISLMISVDTGKGPYVPDMIGAIAEDTGVKEENIFWSTTHTHSTPENKSARWADSLNIDIRHDTMANEYADICARNNSRWTKLVQKQLVVASREAIDNLEEAEVGMGTTQSNINVNRDTQFRANPETTAEGFNGAGPADDTLTTLEFRSVATGEPIAFVIHYAMHNVLLYANDYFNPAFNDAHGVTVADFDAIEEGFYDTDNVDEIVPGAEAELNVAYCETYSYVEDEMPDASTGIPVTVDGETRYSGVVVGNAAVHPDVGGQVSQYVEYNNEGAVALWMSGAAGDINPVLRNCMNYPAPYDMEVGDLKSFEAGSAVELTMKGGLLEAATYYSAIQYVDVKNALKTIDTYETDMPIAHAYGETIVPRDPDQPATGNVATEYNICLSVMTLGDITFAGSNGELFNNIGVEMRDNSDAPNVLVVNHVWPYNRTSDDTYYPDDVAIANNSYRWGNNAKYAIGVIYPAMIELLNDTYAAALAGDDEAGDKDALQALYDECAGVSRGNYTAASWNAFRAALTAAKNVLDDPGATQAEIDAALADLEAAYAALEASDDPDAADKSDLQAQYDEYENLDKDDYTQDSWSAFQQALADAKAVLDDDSATQEEVDEALEALRAAYEALVPADAGTTYTVTATANTGGSVTGATVEAGEDAEIAISADGGYLLAAILVDGVTVDISGVEDKYVIENVQQNMEVRVLFIPDQEEDFAARYTDVDGDDWFYQAVDMLTALGIVEGVSGNAFAPTKQITRAEFTKLMYELADVLGVDVEEINAVSFGDVDAGHWAYGFIGWARETSLVNGYDEETFGPDDDMLRQDMAVFMQRFFEEQRGYDLPGSRTKAFTDADEIGEYAEEAVEYVVRTGLMQGHASGEFGPEETAQRSHVAQVIFNYLIF